MNEGTQPAGASPSQALSIAIAKPEKEKTRHFVTLRVFDVHGKEVAVFESGLPSAGDHTVRWDDSGVPSSVYIYRPLTGEFVSSRKMTLMK